MAGDDARSAPRTGPGASARPRLRDQPVEHPHPLPVGTRQVVVAGMVVWALALAVILLVPALHTGERNWWPWTPVVGLALGALALLFLRRGRGNFENA